MKTYILLLSKVFLKGHPKEGQPTNFKEKFLSGEKIHTIRDNYEYWNRIIQEVLQGNAVLSIREWIGKPYNTKQAIIKNLSAYNGIGIQILDCDKPFAHEIDGIPLHQKDLLQLAKNDGLGYEDFDHWFDMENTTGQKAIIQLTPFRYQPRQ